jgi:hypothetical protein
MELIGEYDEIEIRRPGLMSSVTGAFPAAARGAEAKRKRRRPRSPRRRRSDRAFMRWRFI